jgi:hypothetical protein
MVEDGTWSNPFEGDGALFRPKENVLPAAFRENAEVVLGIGGKGMSLKGLS